MSKESKPRDLWRQVFETAHDRPATWCKGCGYFRVAHRFHRTDCLVDACEAAAIAVVESVLGGRVIHRGARSRRGR
jgi:hypothetical protein